MEILTLIFVFALCGAAFLLTVTFRREFKARDQLRRDHALRAQQLSPRRTPHARPRPTQSALPEGESDSQEQPPQELTAEAQRHSF